MRRVKAECPGKDVWAYTGYVLDRDLAPGGECCTADTAELLHTIDVLVDGPFVTELHDISLLFKGSSNQRVIDCAEYCRSGSGADVEEGRILHLPAVCVTRARGIAGPTREN